MWEFVHSGPEFGKNVFPTKSLRQKFMDGYLKKVRFSGIFFIQILLITNKVAIVKIPA